MNDWQIIKVDECLSTNSFIQQKKQNGELNDKTAIMTDFQSSGRGQGQNAWHSEAEKNFLVSVFRKTKLNAENHFMLTIMASLSIINTLKVFGVSSQIKWPNDIYVGDKKIAGILIENSLMKDLISDTIIGVGLNINQLLFPESIPNPISIAQIIRKEIDIKNILSSFIEEFDALFSKSENGEGEELFHKYTEQLYRLKEWKIFEYKGHKFTGQIRGVMPDGRLIIEAESGQLKRFLFGEVKYII